VADKVVLDLVYESRDIEQQLGSQEKIDAWFDAKTKGLNDWQKQALREQWGTMQKVLSSRSRMERVVEDIVFDFGVKPRLASQRGNAILVASSIYEAVKYYELFQKTAFKGRCAVVTSYNPQAKDVTLEETGENTETEKQFIFNAYTVLLKDVEPAPNKSKTETYEDNSKKQFIKDPAKMRLLIVVDKLLTGFDAPSCTYLYIDKSMQDHGLFQAICRTNRLDGEDKSFGYIVDYKDLFKKLINEKGTGALQVYSSELDESAPGASSEILMQDRLKKGRERLEAALETMAMLCESVEPPKGELEHIHYFCGNTEVEDDLKEHEPQRAALYKGTAAMLRAYANIADDLPLAGYTTGQAERIKGDVERYIKLREIIRQASGETIDLKAYEADMRHLIDTYIEAKEPKKTSHFDEIGLLEVIVKSGMADAIAGMPEGIKNNPSAVAETIANNVRSKIVQEQLNNPAFYEKMSELLKEIIADLRAKRISYEQFLKQIAELAKQVHTGADSKASPKLDTPGKRALYDNLLPKAGGEDGNVMKDEAATYGDDAEIALNLALQIDAVVKQVRPAGWRGVKSRENIIKAALMNLLNDDKGRVERIFLILVAQKEY
jgi:type I restriction enzyme R subunit